VTNTSTAIIRWLLERKFESVFTLSSGNSVVLLYFDFCKLHVKLNLRALLLFFSSWFNVIQIFYIDTWCDSDIMLVSAARSLLRASKQGLWLRQVRLLTDEPASRKIPMLASFTLEIEAKLAAQGSAKQLRMQSIQLEIERLDQRDFPLPEALTEQQWSRLLSLSEWDLRLYYLDAISQKEEEEKLEDLLAKDKVSRHGLK